jgi:peptide/nickel transport system permease protein
LKNKRILNRTSLALVILFVLTAIFADVISPYDPWDRFEPYEKPGRNHILGTNDIGNDILSELIHGSRASLVVGIGAAIIATLIGLSIGLLSGYFKGALDELLMGVTDIFLMIPRIPLIIILAAFLKSSSWLIMFALGLLWWTSTARVARSRTLQVREMDFVASAKCLGFSSRHIIFSEILPNIFPVIVPKFMLTIATAMISEASLSFLGLGDPSMKSWGLMINFSLIKGGLVNEMWWWYLPPGLCIILFVYSIVSLGFSFEEHREITSDR